VTGTRVLRGSGDPSGRDGAAAAWEQVRCIHIIHTPATSVPSVPWLVAEASILMGASVPAMMRMRMEDAIKLTWPWTPQTVAPWTTPSTRTAIADDKSTDGIRSNVLHGPHDHDGVGHCNVWYY